jgi:hypothetical protein
LNKKYQKLILYKLKIIFLEFFLIKEIHSILIAIPARLSILRNPFERLLNYVLFLELIAKAAGFLQFLKKIRSSSLEMTSGEWCLNIFLFLTK